MADPGPARHLMVPVAAVSLLFAYALSLAGAPNMCPDFFIYRAGAEIGLRGESPYDIPRVRALVAEQYPNPNPTPDSFVNNCGYFLPPMAVLVYAPFAILPWTVAKIAWAVLVAGAAFGITLLPELFRRPGIPPDVPGPVWGQLVPVLLVVNFLTLAVVQVGQTTVLAVGCVAFGQWCFERGRPALGVVLWAVPFIKPHVALPLIRWRGISADGSERRGVLGVVAGLNVIGAVVIGGTPLFLSDYLTFLSTGHKAVAFNLAERNYEIISWNRLLFVATEPFAGARFLVEQTAVTTLAGYVVWCGVVVGRCAVGGGRPSPAWAAAAAVAAAVWCPQVLVYEALFLAVAVPWVRELFAAGRRVRGWAVALALGVELIPFRLADAAGVDFYLPLGTAVFAVLVLAGPIAPRARD